MKRKIIASLLLLFLFSASGAVIAAVIISRTTETLSRLITLHQIEDLRKHLVISIQTVQSDLYTVRTMLGQKVDIVAENVTNLEGAAATCSSCHHEPLIAGRIKEVQDLVGSYQNALSYYITASANRERIDKLKSDAAAIGNQLLVKTEQMSFQASKRLEETTSTAMSRIRSARAVLFLTMGLTLVFGGVVGFHLTRAIAGPVQKLVEATRAFARGDLGHRLDLDDRTEFGELASHFDHMGQALQENYGELTQEIKERRHAEEALRESEERYALAARGANDGLWDWDLKNNRIYYSERWKSMLGFGEREIGALPEDWLGRIHSGDREQVEARIKAHLDNKNPHFESEYRIQHRDGSWRWVLCRGIAVRDASGKATRMAGSQTDITARKSAEEQLVYDAFHDAHTGLPNRALFMDRLEHVIASSRRHPTYLYAVLFIDLDRFKVINDSLGHNIGDKLLISVARRLSTILRPGDTVARLGGDEFAILLEDISDVSDAEDITRRLEQTLAPPHTIDGHEIYSAQSIGIALRSERYEWPEQILRDADIAMYEAKSKGRARHEFFDTKMHASIIDRLQTEADLRLAVEHHEGFQLHYQPIVHMQTQKLLGFEALVRWNHKTRGLVYPGDFIPIAEETGMISSLSGWIIGEACRQLKEWQRQYPLDPLLKMSVNISSRLLTQPGFVDSISTVLSETGLAPCSLALEITETVLLSHTEAAMETLTRLRDLGVQIHIDDFGTGYSSLSYLHNFPVNALKIDRSFIAKMTGTDNQEIVRTIVALAQSLKLEVIAEGVELDQQADAVRDLACTYAQGFLFAKPMSAQDAGAWLAAKNRGAA